MMRKTRTIVSAFWMLWAAAALPACDSDSSSVDPYSDACSANQPCDAGLSCQDGACMATDGGSEVVNVGTGGGTLPGDSGVGGSRDGGGDSDGGSSSGGRSSVGGGSGGATDSSVPKQPQDVDGILVTVMSYRAVAAPGNGGGLGGAGSELDPVIDYIETTGAVCEEEWEDFGCDGQFPLFPAEENCPDEERIDYAQGTACPVCLAPPRVEPSCAETRRRYLEFVDHNLRETCSNWCESDSDCFVQPLSACGLNHVAALYGGIDEEVIAFSESFDLDNCHVCPAGDDAQDNDEYLSLLSSTCVQHQCVVTLDARTSAPEEQN